MDQLDELFKKRVEKVKALQDFVVLFGKRKELKVELRALYAEHCACVNHLNQIKKNQEILGKVRVLIKVLQ